MENLIVGLSVILLFTSVFLLVSGKGGLAVLTLILWGASLPYISPKSDSNTKNTPISYENDTKYKNTVELFKNQNKSWAADAIWTANDIFKVGVYNTGEIYKGYAMYTCQFLYDNGFKGKQVWVQIIDMQKLVLDNKWVKISDYHCL